MCVCFGRRDGWRWSFDLMTTGARKLDNSLLHLLPTTWFSPTTTTIVGTTPRPRSQHCVCVLLMYCRGFSWKFDGESAPLWWSLCICRSKVKVAETRDGERKRSQELGFEAFIEKSAVDSRRTLCLRFLPYDVCCCCCCCQYIWLVGLL